MKESDLWKRVKEALGSTWLCYRIESSITPGFPDVIAIFKDTGDIYFVELKVFKGASLVPRFGALSTVQMNVHANLHKAKVNNFVLGVDKKGSYFLGRADGMNPMDWIYMTYLDDLSKNLRRRKGE